MSDLIWRVSQIFPGPINPTARIEDVKLRSVYRGQLAIHLIKTYFPQYHWSSGGGETLISLFYLYIKFLLPKNQNLKYESII